MSENTEIVQNTPEEEPEMEKADVEKEITMKNEEILKAKIVILEQQLQEKSEERENYKNQVQALETELAEARISPPPQQQLSASQAKEVEIIKQKSEELLLRAKGVIFDKTKIIKNQELQIEALSQQVASLKDVVSITKDLLEIRNMEVTHLKEKMECMEEKMNIEKDRQTLMHAKLDSMVRMNIELKSEYEKQLALFIELKGTYEARTKNL